MKRSLRFRVSVLFTVVVGAFLACAFLGFYVILVGQLEAQLDYGLHSAAEPVLARLQAGAGAGLALPHSGGPNDIRFEVVSGHGRVEARSANLGQHALPLPAKPMDRSQFWTAKSTSCGPLRVGVFPMGRSGKILITAVPMTTVNAMLGDLRALGLFLVPLSALLAGLMGDEYVARSLRPVAAITLQAARMAQRLDDPERGAEWTPLPVADPHDEIGLMASTFNFLLDRTHSTMERLRRFVSDASHELRTPLAVLQGETELALSRPRSAAEYRASLEVVDSELRKLKSIVGGLFTLSMADAGQLALNEAELYLDDVLHECVRLMEPIAQQRGIRLQAKIESDVRTRGDEACLHQLFVIFLDNALKFTPSGGTVRAQLGVRNGWAEIEFNDNGPGIAAEDMPRIFERFYRAPNPGANVAGHSGGGLGLAIAVAIVHRGGGWIDCRSEPGWGTSFVIHLRLPEPDNFSSAGAGAQPSMRYA